MPFVRPIYGISSGRLRDTFAGKNLTEIFTGKSVAQQLKSWEPGSREKKKSRSIILLCLVITVNSSISDLISY